MKTRKTTTGKKPIPFDDALRRLVNTPPKPKKSSGDKKKPKDDDAKPS